MPRWGERIDNLEAEISREAYERTPIGIAVASSHGWAITDVKFVKPVQYAQGLARGHWQGGSIGRHPGYGVSPSQCRP